MNIYTNHYLQQIQSISIYNKYTDWYCRIIYRAQQRATTRKDAERLTNDNIEKHHIVPKSFKLGGETDRLNYAYLTTKEHFICHRLLTKMLTGSYLHLMHTAALRLATSRNTRFINSRTYAILRKNHAIARSIETKGIKFGPRTEEQKQKSLATRRSNGTVAWNKGKKTGESPLKGIRKTTVSPLKGKPSGKKGIPGRPQTEESKEKIRQKRKLQVMQPRSQESKDKVSASLTGKPKSDQHRQNLSISRKGKPGPKSGAHCKPITIRGVTYLSMQSAADALNISVYKVKKLI